MNCFYKYFKAVVLLFLLSIISITASAQTPKRVVKVGYYIRPGFLEVDSKGNRFGFGYDFLMAVASHTNWELFFCDINKSRSEHLKMLRDGELDLLVGVIPNERFADDFAFSEAPVVLIRQQIVVKKNQGKYIRDDYRTWKGMKIAMIKNRPTNQQFLNWVKNNKIDLIPIYFDNDLLAEKAYFEEKVDALLSIDGRHSSKDWCLKSLFPHNSYFAVNKKAQSLLNELNEAITEVDYEIPNLRGRLAIKYYGANQPYILNEKVLYYSEKCIRENKVFKVLMNPVRPPVSYYRDGQWQGFQVRHVKKILAHTKLKYSFIKVTTQQEYAKVRDSGNYDIILDSSCSISRAEKINARLSNIYLSAPASTITCDNGRPTCGKFGAIEESNIYDALCEYQFNCDNLHCFPTWDKMLNAMHTGEIDYAFLPTRICNDLIKITHRHRLVTNLHPSLKVNYCFAVHKKNPVELVRILNQAIAITTYGELEESMSGFTYQGSGIDSLSSFIKFYPVEAFSIAITILILIVIIFVIYLFQSRKHLRFSKIIRRLPIKFVVIGNNDEILLHNISELTKANKKFNKITDFSDPNLIETLTHGSLIARRKGSYNSDYVRVEGEKYALNFIRLDWSIMHSNAVCCIAQDTTELFDMKEQAEKTSKQLELTLQSISDAVIVTDPEGKITLTNAKAQQLLGLTEDDIIGKSAEKIMRLVNASDNTHIENPVNKALNLRQTVSLTNHTDLISHDGNRYHIADSAAPLISTAGDLLGAILDVRDITAEYEQRAEMVSLLNLIQQIISIVPFGFFTKDVDDEFRYTMVNDFTASMLGTTKEEAIGKRDCDLEYVKLYADEIRKWDLETLNAPDGIEFTHEFLTLEGKKYTLRTFKKVLTDATGKRFLLGACTDVTILNKALLDAQAADRAKSYFLAVMSHEIRTPLNAIIGLSEMLLMGNISKTEQEDLLRSIHTSGDTLLGLINDILDISKLEADQLQMVYTSTDLNELVEDLHKIFQDQLQNKELSFSLQGFNELPLVEVDTMRIKQVLLNLLGNAVKFTHVGGISLSANFEPTDKEHGKLCLKVTDTGIGIRPDSFKRIFEPFAQEDEVRGNRKYGGTGLGLCISKRLIERMQGRISVNSQLEKGTTFTIDLVHVKYDTKTYKTKQKNPLEVAHFEGQPSILVVDDVPLNLKVIGLMLKNFGAVPILTGSGAEALEVLRHQKVDLIFTDVWMPEMNGVQFAAKAREILKGKNIKIIALTADTEADVYFETNNFDSTLLKPITIEKLQLVCSEVFAKSDGGGLEK